MITTATLWVCSNCGYVDRLDGHAGSGQMNQYCPTPIGETSDSVPTYRRHSLKPVLVVVPYA